MNTTNKGSRLLLVLVAATAFLQLATFVMMADVYIRFKRTAAAISEVFKPQTEKRAAPRVEASSVSQRIEPAQSAPDDVGPPLEMVSIDTKVTEQNSTWWKYSWIAMVRNRSSSPQTFRIKAEWVDASGFVVDDNDTGSLTIAAGATETFSGYDLVTAGPAANVSGIRGKLLQ